MDHAIDSIEYEHVGRFSTDIWRLRLVGGPGDDAPRLILKRPYQTPRTGEPDELETEFYERVAGSLPVPVPSFIGNKNEEPVWLKDEE